MFHVFRFDKHLERAAVRTAMQKWSTELA
jgi:hypothetical protein